VPAPRPVLTTAGGGKGAKSRSRVSVGTLPVFHLVEAPTRSLTVLRQNMGLEMFTAQLASGKLHPSMPLSEAGSKRSEKPCCLKVSPLTHHCALRPSLLSNLILMSFIRASYLPWN